MRFSVWGIPYNKALMLIEDMRKYGVDANITPGGVAIYPDGTIQTDKMNSVCKKYGTIASRGLNPHEEDVLYRCMGQTCGGRCPEGQQNKEMNKNEI